MLIFLIIINFAISVLNAWIVGRNWAEAKSAGGWARFINWCGAIMAASGFTWCYSILAALAAKETGYLNASYVEGLMRLGYLIVILPIIGAGIGITIESWAHFWRRKTFGNGVAVGWNTFAQVYNMIGAMSIVPESLAFLRDLFDSDDETDSLMTKLLMTLSAVALVGGLVTAVLIVRVTAKRTANHRSLELKAIAEERKAKARREAVG